MIKVLLFEKRVSEQILIRSYLPEYAIVFPVESPCEAFMVVKKSVPDVIIIGSSVSIDLLSETAGFPDKLLQNKPVYILFRKENAVFQNVPPYGLSINYIFVPEELDRIKADINVMIAERLKNINSYDFDWVHDKISAFVGNSAAAKKVKSDILKFCDAPGPVLITGESGTGKEIVAKLLHDFSQRRNEIYYALNAGAIPGGLRETELFGSETGAFTGAVKRKGCFEHAHKGTLFLDEIGELDPGIQVELLRVLEGGTVKRVGANKHIETDVRLISATNRSLMRQVEEGAFRKDLFYRINMFPIKIPPLRERLEDIPDLLRHFSEEISKNRSDRYFEFSDSFIDCLFKHDWPGNIRELRNVLHRAVYSSDTTLLTAESLLLDRLDAD